MLLFLFKKIGSFLPCLEEVKPESFAGRYQFTQIAEPHCLDLSDASDSGSGRRWMSELCVVCTQV